MKKSMIILLLLCLLITTPLSARDMSNLYDDATLEYWQPISKEDILWNFENVILRYLTGEERQILGNVNIEFPLRGEKKDLFEFYASGYTVTMPILSLRFLGDISLAYLWLEVNGYSVSTVPQYIGMIKYKTADQFRGNCYPKPLDALQIPENARDDPKVIEIYSRTHPVGTMAVIFILCHELGHIYHSHPGYDSVSREEARENEAEADRFAVEIMSRIGISPGGAAFFFSSLLRWEKHRSDCGTDEEWEDHLNQSSTHPLTVHRIRDLAKEIEKAAEDFARLQPDYEEGLKLVHYSASLIAGVANILEDEDLHKAFRIEGLVTDLDMLAPRHSDVYVIKPSSEKYPDIPFSGVYDGKVTSSTNPDGVDTRLLLKRKGDKVFGMYAFFVECGTINGYIEGNILHFNWQQRAGASGRGEFQATDGGKVFTGTWGYGDSRDNGGIWNGRRK